MREKIEVSQAIGITGKGEEMFEPWKTYQVAVEKADSYSKQIGVDIIDADFVIYLDISYNSATGKYESPIKVLGSTIIKYNDETYRVVQIDESNNPNGTGNNQVVRLKRRGED